MSLPIRAYLMLKEGPSDWSVHVCRDLEAVLDVWGRRSDQDKPGVLHIGFDRPPSAAFDEVIEGCRGRLLITASGKYGLPTGYETSVEPVGLVRDLPVYLGTRGWGYHVEDAELRTFSGPMKIEQRKMPVGWVADFLTERLDFLTIFDRQGICDDETYIAFESRLSSEERYDAGVFRFHALIADRSDDPCAIARAAPPWLKQRDVATIQLTVRLTNVFASQGITTVGSIAGYQLRDLLRLDNFGRKSASDLCTLLFAALEEGPFSIEAKINDAGAESLRVALDQTFIDLEARQRDILTRRMGYGRPPETLQSIADDYGITRERIRQLESKVIDRIVREAYWDDLLTKKLTAMLIGRNFPLPVLGVEAADSWFVGVAQWSGALSYILENFCAGQITILSIDGIEYFGFLTQIEWETALSEAARLLKFGAGEKWTEDFAAMTVGRLIKDEAKEFRGHLFEIACRMGHFIVDEAGVRVLISYGRGADQAVTAVLSDSEFPLHFSEIAILASERQGRTIDSRRAHSAAAAVGILLGRGIYGSSRHLGSTSEEIGRSREEAERIILAGPPNRQWHCSEILSALTEAEVPIGLMTKYVVDFVLRGSRILKSLGRMTWVADADKSWSATNRIDIRQAIISLIETAGRPLSSSEIQSRLLAVRGVNEIFQISAVDPLIRLGYGLWGLNDRDVPIKRQDQNALFDDLEAFLAISTTGVHISEIESVNFGRVSGVPGNVIFALASSDSRFHVSIGQYLYLTEWGGPRRVSITEAIRSILNENVRPLSLDEIVLLVSKSLDRSIDRNAVSGRLQTLDAIFNAEDRTWLADRSDQEQANDEDFEAEQAYDL